MTAVYHETVKMESEELSSQFAHNQELFHSKFNHQNSQDNNLVIFLHSQLKNIHW